MVIDVDTVNLFENELINGVLNGMWIRNEMIIVIKD